jgi:2-keto-3-deoxy-galactonokinase
MMKEKVSTSNSFFAAMADSASNSVAVAQQSKREEAVDLFMAKYAANLDAMASLKVKQKLFNHDTAALFLKLTDEERFLFLDGLINGDE